MIGYSPCLNDNLQSIQGGKCMSKTTCQQYTENCRLIHRQCIYLFIQQTFIVYLLWTIYCSRAGDMAVDKHTKSLASWKSHSSGQQYGLIYSFKKIIINMLQVIACSEAKNTIYKCRMLLSQKILSNRKIQSNIPVKVFHVLKYSRW